MTKRFVEIMHPPKEEEEEDQEKKSEEIINKIKKKVRGDK